MRTPPPEGSLAAKVEARRIQLRLSVREAARRIGVDRGTYLNMLKGRSLHDTSQSRFEAFVADVATPVVNARSPIPPATSEPERTARSRALASIEAAAATRTASDLLPIGARVRDLRESYGATQSQLAAALGIEESALAAIEAGRRTPRAADLWPLYAFAVGEAGFGGSESGPSLVLHAPMEPGEVTTSPEIAEAIAAGELLPVPAPPGWRYVRAASVPLIGPIHAVEKKAVLRADIDMSGSESSADEQKVSEVDLTPRPSGATLAAMAYPQLKDIVEEADRGDKSVVLGQSITLRLKRRLEAAAKASGLKEAQVLRAVLLHGLPAVEDEESEPDKS